MKGCHFTLHNTDGRARRGTLTLNHGVVETPQFMPVGTYGTVKAMLPTEVRELGATVILGNTFHLWLRPGLEVIAAHGGLHQFMRWNGPILTDSGGFQVFSLAKLRKITEEGVQFASPVDGARVFLSPEESMRIQTVLNSDIVMQFDECTPYPATLDEARTSMALSLRWAARCQHAFEGNPNALFGIVQGGVFEELRSQSIDGLQALDFVGYAIGGLAVGEPKDERDRILSHCDPLLPADKPRYLMGVGKPEDLVEAVARGVDLFDCVMPTRNARNGFLFTAAGTLRIRNAVHARDTAVIEAGCGCSTCLAGFSRSYLRHLDRCNEMLFSRLATAHNLYYYLQLMAGMREAITARQFGVFREQFYRTRGEAVPSL